MKTVWLACGLAAFASTTAVAQSVQGDWIGTLRPGSVELRLVVHIKADDKGELSGSLDSLDQGARGIPINSMSFKDGKLTFTVDRVQGRYEGTHDNDKKLIRGQWSQGPGTLPLDLEPYVEEPKASARAGKPSDIDGDWTGTLEAGGKTLRLVFHVMNNADDKLTASMDIPDEGIKEMPVQVVTRDGKKLNLELRGIGARYAGTLNADLTSIDGTWTQRDNDLPLTLQRAKK